MPEEHKCGPDHDKDFFADLQELLRKHPEQAKKYSINCVDHETDIMGIDFTKQVAIKKIEDNKVVTNFVSMDELEKLKERGPLYCCSWYNEKCVSWWT